MLVEGIKGKCTAADAYYNYHKGEEGKYTEGAFTSAGKHFYELKANDGNKNYEDYVDIRWTIAKADISEYITVTPNNNSKLNGSTENDAIIYDGKNLDGDDFVVSTNKA